MVLIPLVNDVDEEKVSESFRPLAGIMVLIGRNFRGCKVLEGRSFRPLAGIMVLILKRLRMKSRRFARGFRPLAGIMVLILWEEDFKPNGDFAEFPSPCGDYGSYR